MLVLEPYGAALVRFEAPKAPARHPLKTGVLPGPNLKPLPSVTPTTSHGDFVAAELHQTSRTPEPKQPRFDAVGRLTRSNVDTHMFMSFHYDPPQALSALDCLAIDVWVPEAKQKAPKLLVILQQQGGGEFLAETGLSLGTVSHERLLIPLSRFRVAGWSHAGDGILDPGKVSGLSIGWGGYVGTEGETVRFQVGQPEVASASGR